MIVGRETEIAEAQRLLSRGREGIAGLLVEGDAGIGKTTIFRETLRLGRDAGFAVFSCRPAAAESRFALAAVGDLVEDIPRKHWAGLPAPQRRALELALHLADPDGALVEQSAIAAGVRSLIAALASERPVLLAVDDLQWLDDGSSAILGFALRRLERLPIAVIATKRAGEAAGIDLDSSLPSGAVVRTELRPLSLGAVSRLLTEQLDVLPTRSTLVRLHEASGGNPLHAIELARLLAERGPVRSEDPIPVPVGVRAVVGERVSALPAATRDLLLAAALMTEPSIEHLERVLGRRTTTALHAAERSGIARVEEGVIRFAHPLHAAAVIDGAAPDVRRRWHRRLADVTADPVELARHLALATQAPDADVAQRVGAGADAAARRGMLQSAAELLERAATLTPSDDPASARRRLRAAELHDHAGDRLRSRRLVDELLTTPLERKDRAEALRLLGELHLADEDIRGAKLILDEALSFADDAGARASILLVLCYLTTLDHDFSGAAELARRGLDALENQPPDPLLAEALARSAMCDFLAGYGLDREKVERALVLEDPDRMALPGLGAAGVAGLVLGYTGETARALAILAEVRRRLEERGDEAELATVLMWTSWFEMERAHFSAAAEAADEAITYAKLTSNDSMGRLARAQRAWVDAYTGDIAEMRRRAAEATPAPGVGIAQIALFLAGLHALAAITVADYRAAWETCREGVEIIERDGIGEPIPLLFLPDGIEALIGLGKLDRAEALIDALERRGLELDRAWAIGSARRNRGLLLAARGDLKGAIRALDAALIEHDRLDRPFDRARTMFVKGLVLRRSRQRAQAARALAEASAEFGRMGARLWAQRASDELERVGRGHTGASTGLTPAERRVANLARAGRSNKEIAQALYVSVHTVEVHLSSVYAKLGVRSRSQLAQRIPPED